MGRYSTNDPPIPWTDRYVEGRSLLRRIPRLDLHYTGDLATQLNNNLQYAGIAFFIDILDVPQLRKIHVRRDYYDFFFANSP